jgi:hypothetical protein
MTEKNFEDFLGKAAKSYHLPPARAPREEMWAAIEAHRSAGPQVMYGGASSRPGVSNKRFSTPVWIGAAAAALLLVATGVGIGRFTARPAAPAGLAVSPPIEARPIVVPSGGNESAGPQQNGGIASSDVGERSGLRSRTARVATTTGQREPTKENVDQAVGAGAARVSVRGSSSAYQLTTLQHLSEAEALLTSFRQRSPADQQMDAQLASWARQLLSNTRLLLDSPVANDPQRRPLLEDLELVLVQIVQLSPGSTSQDRELIEQTLQHDHVLTRLRTAIPAGPQHGS